MQHLFLCAASAQEELRGAEASSAEVRPPCIPFLPAIPYGPSADTIQRYSPSRQHSATTLDDKAWVGAYHTICCLVTHSSLYIYRNLMSEPDLGATNAELVATMWSQMTPTQRLEAACAEEKTKAARVGCCNLECRVVDGRAGHGEAGVPLLRCSTGKVVDYCCRACQRSAWAEHKLVCNYLVLKTTLRKIRYGVTDGCYFFCLACSNVVS